MCADSVRIMLMLSIRCVYAYLLFPAYITSFCYLFGNFVSSFYPFFLLFYLYIRLRASVLL